MTVAEQRNFGASVRAGRYFTPYTPIDEEALFAGRLDQIYGVIDAVMQKGQHAILYGERGVGKTSLSSVISEFLDVGPILSVRVNCDSADTFGSAWMKLFGEIETVAERPVPGFGGATARQSFSARSLFEGDQTPNGVRRVLSRLSSSSVPILIVDEFDRLPPAPRRAFADLVKMLSDHAVRATVVLVGVADSVDELIAEHESVERALSQIRLPRMSGSEIRQIVENGMNGLRLEIEEEAEDRIVLLSQGLPHYAHLLGLHAARSALLRGEGAALSLPDVDRAVRKGLAGAQQSTRNAFHKATSSPRPENLYKQVLSACALAGTDELGYFAAADVRGPMQGITGRKYGIPAFATHLKQFCGDRRGRILERIGTPRRYRFRFSNPLMQPFIIMKGLDSGMLAPEMLRPDDGSEGKTRRS